MGWDPRPATCRKCPRRSQRCQQPPKRRRSRNSQMRRKSWPNWQPLHHELSKLRALYEHLDEYIYIKSDTPRHVRIERTPTAAAVSPQKTHVWTSFKFLTKFER